MAQPPPPVVRGLVAGPPRSSRRSQKTSGANTSRTTTARVRPARSAPRPWPPQTQPHCRARPRRRPPQPQASHWSLRLRFLGRGQGALVASRRPCGHSISPPRSGSGRRRGRSGKRWPPQTAPRHRSQSAEPPARALLLLLLVPCRPCSRFRRCSSRRRSEAKAPLAASKPRSKLLPPVADPRALPKPAASPRLRLRLCRWPSPG